MSTFFFDGALEAGATVSLPEAAAHHARVKRLAVGETVRLTNGAGTRAAGSIARIAKSALDVSVQATEPVRRPATVDLYVPVADRDRMLWLAEKATELGATGWHPVHFHRSRSVSPRGEGEAFAAKVRARMVSALEQSGGGWMPVVHPEIDVAAAARIASRGVRVVLDAAGGRLDTGRTTGSDAAIIVGPEGGMEPAELTALVQGGWQPVSLGPTTLRFETAGIAALAVLRAAQVPPTGEKGDDNG